MGPGARTARAFIAAIAAAKRNLALPPAIQDEILRCTGTAPLPYHVQAMLSQIEDLRKDPTLVSVADVASARDAALREADFDHYFERLEAVFEADELELALRILSHLAGRPSSDLPTIRALSPGNDGTKNVLRTLLEDGYVTDERTTAGPNYLFSNPMLKAYWVATRD